MYQMHMDMVRVLSLRTSAPTAIHAMSSHRVTLLLIITSRSTCSAMGMAPPDERHGQHGRRGSRAHHSPVTVVALQVGSMIACGVVDHALQVLSISSPSRCLLMFDMRSPHVLGHAASQTR